MSQSTLQHQTPVVGTGLRNGEGAHASVAADPVKGPLAWEPAALSQEGGQDSYVLSLDPSEALEIGNALQSLKGLGVGLDKISPQNFQLAESLRQRLDSVSAALHDGPGLALIRGMDTSQLSAEDNLSAYLGVASYIGDQLGLQDKEGKVVSWSVHANGVKVHVTDAKQWASPYEKRHDLHTNGSLPFHTDMGCDILSLQVRHCAKEGGYTRVASSATIYNDLLENNPEVLKTLCEPQWPIQVSGREQRYILCPLVERNGEKIMMSLDPGRLGLHPNTARPHPADRHPGGVPPLTEAQLAALAALSQTAERHSLRVRAQPGDVLLLNNWALLHARDSYTDNNGAGEERRHLVRLWLRSSARGWDVPDSMRVPWQAAYEYDAAGVDVKKQYAVEPEKVYKEPKYTTGSASFVLEDDTDEE